MKYFGFAIADSMINANTTLIKKEIALDGVREFLKGDVNFCLNPSHVPTIDAAKGKYGLNIEVPETAPKVNLRDGDELVVMSVRGLPRLEGRHEYTSDEIEVATFTFSHYDVVSLETLREIIHKVRVLEWCEGSLDGYSGSCGSPTDAMREAEATLESLLN